MGADKNRCHACEIAEMLRAGCYGEGGCEPLAGMSRKLIGSIGEMLASQYLEEEGYELVDRNYRCCEGEADLVVYDTVRGETVLVEVKTRRRRTGSSGGYPEEAVTAAKLRRYRRIAYQYVAEHYPTQAIRFDVVAVTLGSDRVGEICHLRNVFDWEAL